MVYSKNEKKTNSSGNRNPIYLLYTKVRLRIRGDKNLSCVVVAALRIYFKNIVINKFKLYKI